MKKGIGQLISVYIYHAIAIIFVLSIEDSNGIALFVFMALVYLIYWLLSAQKSWFSWTAYLHFLTISIISGMTMMTIDNDSIRWIRVGYIAMLIFLTPLLGCVNFVLWSMHDKPKD